MKHFLRRHAKVIAVSAALLGSVVAHAAGLDDFAANAIAVVAIPGVYFAPYEGKEQA